MATPLQRGIVDMAYAIERAAVATGDAGLIARAHELSRDVAAPGFFDWLSEGFSLEGRAYTLAEEVERLTGVNPIKVDDGQPATGTPRQNAVSPLSDAGEVLRGAAEATSSALDALAGALGKLGTVVLVGVGVAVAVVVYRELRP